MAIMNVTPDSFYSKSRVEGESDIESRVRQAVSDGAAIIDIGGYSSRPGADDVSPEEELRRVTEGVEVVCRLSPDMKISVDTFRASVVEGVVARFGKVIVNDISAGELDAEMIPTVARLDLPYIAMHMKGDPKTMQSLTGYERDITSEVVDYFRHRVATLLEAGIRRENIILDPGFGFAKTLEQNYVLLKGLHRLVELGYPVLAGLSRKSMIYKALGTSPEEALAGTVALDWECLRQGAVILRVHDVREAVESVRLFNIFNR